MALSLRMRRKEGQSWVSVTKRDLAISGIGCREKEETWLGEASRYKFTKGGDKFGEEVD